MESNKAKKPLDTTKKDSSWTTTLTFIKERALENEKKTSIQTAEINHYQNILDEVNRLNQEVKDLKEENLNHIARLQTMARRHNVDNQQAIKYGSQDLARSILKPLDLFKKIINTPAKNEEIKNYLLGFEMIGKQLDQALIDNGIKQINVKVGDEFNPRFHEATELIETKAVPKGKIAAINANGYQLHDRVLTHALVKVAK